MTTRKLTPAEALAALRSRYDSDRTYETWSRILEEFGNGDPGRFASECWNLLEDALSQQQKPAAPHAMEPSCAKCGHPQSNHPFRHPSQPVMLSLGASPPAAPVPSDEEIVAQLGYVMASQGELVEVYGALRLLARRIGVQGVPQ